MPENLNVAIVLQPTPTSSERRQLVRRLFDMFQECLGRPVTIARSDWKDASFLEIPWTQEIDFLGEPLGDTTLLHVYAHGGKVDRASLMVEERDHLAKFVISVPLLSLYDVSLDEFEHDLVALYEECSRCGECIIVVGPELSFELATSVEGVLAEVSGDPLATAVVTSTQMMPIIGGDFAVVWRDNEVQVLRHVHAESRFHPRFA
jgi:hypothetical protein